MLQYGQDRARRAIAQTIMNDSRPIVEPRKGSANEQILRLFVDSVRDYAIFVLDPQGHVATWNAGAERIKGYAAQEIIGQHFSKFYMPDAVNRDYPAYELDVAAAEGRFEDEGWRVRKDGSHFWANVVITALRDASGVLVGFGKVTRDLTARREYEESLRQSEERFRLLVEEVPDYAFFMLDPNGYILTWNSGAERIKGYRAVEIIGQHFSRFYPADAIASGWPNHELDTAATEGRFEDEGWRLRKDGRRFWANVVITALRDPSGRLRGFAKLTRDLSERRKVEAHDARRDQMLDAERSARMEAQRAARIKDEFLATLSHELRSPLSAILGWTQILRAPHTLRPQDMARGLEVIERNARAQVKLIDDLLDLSRIMAGRVALDLQDLEISDIVGGAVESSQPTAMLRGVRLEAVLDRAGAVVRGDGVRLQQIIWNLLSNALKFTPKGGRVRVLSRRLHSQIEISVSDTGIGIPAEYLPQVFDRFSQKDSTPSRQHGGLGLGLAICKQLVELHGGTICADSKGEGQGTTFTVTLPLATAGDARMPIGDTPLRSSECVNPLLPDLNGSTILVVDDEADSRELVQRILADHGAQVTAVGSAQDALRTLETHVPDVIVSDIGMPGMDGYQLMRRIRAGERDDARVRALALTAFARKEDQERVIRAGYQAHLAKPFDAPELVIAVSELLTRTE